MPKAATTKKKVSRDSKPISNKESIQIERKAILSEMVNFSEFAIDQLGNLSADFEENFTRLIKMFKSHEDILHGVLIKMENIDEMMGCILVAVRQNEYLQTYYPSQHGFPAGKYIGIHPSKLEEVKK